MKKLPLDQIIQGNCLDLLVSLPDESVDVIVSSPPYNLGKEYEAKRALAVYLEEQTVVLRECARVLKKTGFRREGLLRGYLKREGVVRDELIFAQTRPDWLAR